jgi:hypothetical protein
LPVTESSPVRLANGTEFKVEKTNRLRKQIPPDKERERKTL